MIKDENYINVQGWMLNKLHLKGNPLLVFALIYGFCQDGSSCFMGSLEYIQEWTNSTRQGVINALKTLVKDQLIIKEEATPSNHYYVNFVYLNDKFNLHVDESECKQNLQYTIDNNTNNIDNNYIKSKEESDLTEVIINYMNKVCGTKFKSSTNGTKKVIKARLKDGAKLQDFFDVINYKYEEWGRVPKKFTDGQMSNMYLRPSTLFGPKMEEYLQQAWIYQSSEGSNIESVKKSEDRSDLVF